MPTIVHQSMRHLKCLDPRCVDNFKRVYLCSFSHNKLLYLAQESEKVSAFPLSETARTEYEELDKLRCQAVIKVERKSQKLSAGQVAFSSPTKALMTTIKACLLLLKCAQGWKISSRYLSHTVAKAQLYVKEKNTGERYIQGQFRTAYLTYYLVKGNARQFRKTFLTNLAEARGEKSNWSCSDNFLFL
jgi:hypothetical protein